MAVYTDVGDDELADFLAAYDLGRLMSIKGIAEGVENSNYFLHMEAGTYILTLYEKRVNPADLPFFIGLMQHLAGAGPVSYTHLDVYKRQSRQRDRRRRDRRFRS